MKRIIYMLAAVLLFAACGEKEDIGSGNGNGTENGTGNENGNEDGGNTELTLEQQMTGEWHSQRLVIDGDIYLSLASDKTMELYQQIGEGTYRLYRGTWTLENDILSGKYNDGENWAASYKVTMDNGLMILVSDNAASEESAFEKAEIPAQVKENCVVEVKSSVL